MKDLKENLKKIVSAEVNRQLMVLKSEMLLEMGRMEQRIINKLLIESKQPLSNSDITTEITKKVTESNGNARMPKRSLIEMITGEVEPFTEVETPVDVDMSMFFPKSSAVLNQPFEIPETKTTPNLFESATIAGTDGNGVINLSNEKTQKVIKTIENVNFREKIKAMEKHAKRR